LIGPPVAEKLPRASHFRNLVQIQICGEHFVLIPRSLGNDLPARIGEVARSVKLADVPGRLGANAVDGSDKVAVGRGVRRLLELPKIFAEAGDGCGRIEDDLCSVEAEAASTLGKVAVVANVDADLCEAEIEDGITEIAGAEIELLPKARRDVGYVGLAIFAEIGAIVLDDCRGVIEDAFLFDFVDRDTIAMPSSFASDRMRVTVGPSGTGSVDSYHLTDCSAQK
jgi:hypothetical protein